MIPPAPPRIHVAAAMVGEWRARVDELCGWLDDGERHRADAFRDPRGRQRFIVAHALLRSMLAARLGRRPADVRLGADLRGRPCYADEGVSLRCSLSHAGGSAVAAVADGADVGVDVEPVDVRRADLRTVARFLPRYEALALGELPEAARPRAIALAWTRLEAEAKGRGVSLDGLAGRPRTGHLEEIAVGSGHVATLWSAAGATVLHDPGLGSPPAG